MKHQPPQLARRFFEWMAGHAPVDDLLGDLDEWYALHLRQYTPRRAAWLYWKQVLQLSFSYALRKRKRDVRHGRRRPWGAAWDMALNYLKVATRNLYQYRYFSFLNAFGLAIGMSISLLLIAVYSYVATYDNFHEHGDDVYTINTTRLEGVEEQQLAPAPLALAERLQREFAGAQRVVSIVRPIDRVVTTVHDDIPVQVYEVTPDFLSVFSFPLLQGTASVLATPGHIILTQAAARRILGTEDVVGKTLVLSEETVVVSGLLKDPPRNTHLNIEILQSPSRQTTQLATASDAWQQYNRQYVYVHLRPGATAEDLQTYVDRIAHEVYSRTPVKVSFHVQPLRDIAMGPDLWQAIGTKWEASGFWMFGVFAALILLPACFNYTNLSIARALKRAKEIGLRKTMGGERSQIFLQFVTETVVITILAAVGALLLFLLIRDEFKSMLASSEAMDLSLTSHMLVLFALFTVLTGILAGIFPALYFSRLHPIEALKSRVNGRGTSMRLRRVLTIFQFALSFGFIMSLMVFGRQYQYSVGYDYGFVQAERLDVPLQDVQAEAFKTLSNGLAAVQSVAFSSGVPGIHSSSTWLFTSDHDSTEVAQWFVDAPFIPQTGLTILAGHNFPDEPWRGERYIIVNETFLSAHSITRADEVLGRIYTVAGQDLEVIGVVKDFHYGSLRYPIGSFCMRMNPTQWRYAHLAVVPGRHDDVLNDLEGIWKRLPTQRAFMAHYRTDELADAYQTYQVLLKIVGFLGLLAITISLLGMLGMVMYTAETKAREVGIRRVMGATLGGITWLLSRDYLKMMGWAIVVAMPLAFWLLSEMLPRMQHYSVQPSLWDVVWSAVILVVLGLLTIASQTYKTANANPAETLRVE